MKTGVPRGSLFAKVLLVERGLDTTRLAERTNTLAFEHNPDTIFVDKTGVGAGVFDQLRTLNAPVRGVAFAESPADGERFVNRRAEVWWKVREWLENGGILEKNDRLRADLIAPEYLITDRSKIQLESKESMRKRGLPSPDLGDALALTFALPVRKKGQPVSVQNTYRKNFNPYSGIESRR